MPMPDAQAFLFSISISPASMYFSRLSLTLAEAVESSPEAVTSARLIISARSVMLVKASRFSFLLSMKMKELNGLICTS